MSGSNFGPVTPANAPVGQALGTPGNAISEPYGWYDYLQNGYKSATGNAGGPAYNTTSPAAVAGQQAGASLYSWIGTAITSTTTMIFGVVLIVIALIFLFRDAKTVTANYGHLTRAADRISRASASGLSVK